MLVRLFWPDRCIGMGSYKKDRRVGTQEQREDRCIDFFWVEATKEEAEAQILPFVSPDIAQKSYDLARDIRLAALWGTPTRPFCCLIAQDLSEFVPLKSSFPYGGMWNAYSPFGEFAPALLQTLDELRQFTVPELILWHGIRENSTA